jgi:tetratricopeptide (TPR) repeat protein
MADWTAKLGLPTGRRSHLRATALSALAALVVLAVPLVASSSSAAPAPRAFQAPRDCFQPLDRTNALTLDPIRDTAKLQNIAQSCAAAAEQNPQRGLIFAYFFAGWANRVLGAGPLAPPPVDDGLSIDSTNTLNETQLREAVRLLEISARMASVSNADDATATAGRRSRLELVRAHRLLGRLRDQDHLTEADRELTALSRDAGDLQRSISYERAMIVLDGRASDASDDDAQLLSVLQDLSTFTTVDPSATRDQYIVDRGPTQLARLAVYMGNRALNRQPQTVENTQLALRNFRDAVSAYAVVSQLGGNVDRVQAANIRVSMGLINLRMASVLGQAQQDTYGCLPGADSYSIGEAEANFTAARDLDPQSPDAQWGLGCALMARNNFSAAVISFQQAVAHLNAPGARALPRSDYYLGLARALAALDQWDGQNGAVAYFQGAIASENDPTRIAGIHLEIARIYARKERWAQARASLQASISARPGAQAYLLLGKTLYDHPELESGSGLSARDSLKNAAQIDGPHQAESNYYLSLVEQRARHGRDAVLYATTAARLDHSNPSYREQACLTRIIFSLTHDSGGQAYCTADATDRDAYPRALFYEGMFWLREAYISSGGNQRNSWAQAISSFEHGTSELGGRQVLVDNISLQRLLAYGRRFALYCAGLGAAVQAQPGDIESDAERSDFRDRYNLGRCWAS